MRLVAIGLSHHTAPVELREKLAVSPDAVPRVLQRLKDEGVVAEAVLISTCNRVELYTVPTDGTDAEQIVAWLAEMGGLRPRVASPHLYRFQEEEALRHLFRVASSLDSMVVGEPQILGQVKEAYRMATDARAAGTVMHRIMDRALSVAKRVRTETGIGREAVSVGRAGVELARQVLGELTGRSALLIGAGAHGKLVARSMLSYGLGELVVSNRTFQRAVELAEMFGGTATHLDEVDQYLRRVDVVVTSTAAGRVLIDRASLAPLMQKRRYRSLVMIDLSVPRNIAPDVNKIDGVYRFDVDDLSEVAEQGHDRRRQAAQDAEKIIGEETQRFWRQLMGEAVSDRIGGVVRLAEQVRQGEMSRARSVLDRLDEADRRTIEAMTRAMVKKVLHRPLTEVRRLAEQGELGRVEEILGAFGVAEAPPRPEKKPAPPRRRTPPMRERLVLGTRGSKLALTQSQQTADLIRATTGIPVVLQVITTRGDQIQDRALAELGGKGLFTAELEAALHDGSIDLAVHSLKDLPTEDAPGLVLASVPRRADPRDVVVGAALDAMPAGSVLGTGSLRRHAQAELLRPDLEIRGIRGNVDTRLRKLDQGQFDAIVLAAAGLARLGIVRADAYPLDVDAMVPAVGQGALAIQSRANDAEVLGLLRQVEHAETRRAVDAERAFLLAYGGGCNVPAACHARVDGDLVHVTAVGPRAAGGILRVQDQGTDGAAIGRKLAATLRGA